MNLWKLFISLFILLLGIKSCVDDDICEGDTSPKCIFVFKDAFTGERLKADSLYVDVENSEIYSAKVLAAKDVDSISIPMSILPSVTSTTFYFYKYHAQPKDKLELSYVNSDQYVSPACGFKRVYLEVTSSLTQQNFILNFAQNTSSIENENSAHFYILH